MDNFRECLRHTVSERLEGLKKNMKKCGPKLQASHSSLDSILCVSGSGISHQLEWSDLTVIITMWTNEAHYPLWKYDVITFWKDREKRPRRRARGSFVVGKMVTAKTCVPHTTLNINVTNFILNFASTQILSPDDFFGLRWLSFKCQVASMNMLSRPSAGHNIMSSQ